MDGAKKSFSLNQAVENLECEYNISEKLSKMVDDDDKIQELIINNGKTTYYADLVESFFIEFNNMDKVNRQSRAFSPYASGWGIINRNDSVKDPQKRQEQINKIAQHDKILTSSIIIQSCNELKTTGEIREYLEKALFYSAANLKMNSNDYANYCDNKIA